MINSFSLLVAFRILRDRLVAVIREGHARPRIVKSLFSSLGDLDLPQDTHLQEACVLWLRQILDSGYPDRKRYSMASSVVALFGKNFDSPILERLLFTDSATLLPLSDFLLLSEKFYPTEAPQYQPPYPGVMALRVLSIGVGGPRGWPECRLTLAPTILQTLTPALLPTHPLRSRRSALLLFQGTEPMWFSTQAEAFSNAERAKLLGAVGDPFRFTPDPPPQDGQPLITADYDPILSAALLIAFAGMDLWRDHLFPSNFVSCEEVFSTEEGRHGFFQRAGIWDMRYRMRRVDKLASALRHLEEMECWNTAEVVVMWAWTDGLVDTTDYDAWKVIGHETVKFYRIRGMDRLGSLSRHVKSYSAYGSMRDWNTSCQVAGVRRPVRLHLERGGVNGVDWWGICEISRACQLRRLYQLFGFDPTTWEEAIAAGKVDGKLPGTSNLEGEGQSVFPIQLLYSACDYPEDTVR